MISKTNFIEGFILNLKMMYIINWYKWHTWLQIPTSPCLQIRFIWRKKTTSRLGLFSENVVSNQSLYSWVAWDWFQLHPATPDMLQSDSTTDRSAPPPTGAVLLRTAGAWWMWCWWQTFQGANYTSRCVTQKMGITASYIYTCILNMYFCMTEMLDLYKCMRFHEFPNMHHVEGILLWLKYPQT